MATLMLAAVLSCGTVAAWAQQTPLRPSAGPPPAPETRWSFKRVDDGFVRLDNKTGQVAHCTPVHVGWRCQAVPENRSALEKQVTQLQAKVAALKKEIARLRASLPPPPPKHGPAVSLKMPTQADIAHARDYVTRAVSDTWHRLVQMIAHFRHDVLRKS